MQNFGASHIQALQSGGFFIPSSHNNSQLYAAVQASLADSLVLGSKICVSSRDNTGVTLVTKGPNNTKKLIKAKRLLVTIPPTRDNMYPFDLNANEKTLFSKWQWQNIFAGVLANHGLPDGLDIVNTSPDASPAAYNLPKTPFVWQYVFSGVPGLYKTQVVGGPDLNMHRAKELVRSGVDAIGAGGSLGPTKHLDFAAFADHSVSQLRPSAADLAAGFYQQLYGLQGKRSTFYTGAAWATDYTTHLWVFTETVLPGLLAGL